MSAKCNICTDPETDENPIFTCINCNVGVHKLCYGIREDFFGQWLCSPCTSGISDPVCELCLLKGGALKKTTHKKMWVHVICALFTEGVKFENKNRMEPVNIMKVPQTHRNQKCVFCMMTHGVCCECSQSNCENWLHVTCAQKANCLREEVGHRNKISFQSFCPRHYPVNGSNRRISSDFVREAVTEKSPTPAQEAYKMVFGVGASGSGNRSDFGDDLQSFSADGARDLRADRTIASAVATLSEAHIDNPIHEHDSSSSLNRHVDTYGEWEFSEQFQGTSTQLCDHASDLLRKDAKIDKLKMKKKELKSQVIELKEEKSNLELQVQQLNSKLSQLLKKPKEEDGQRSAQLKPSREPKPFGNHVDVLEQRIERHMSDDGTEILFANGVKVSAKLMRKMETISGDAAYDRKFVNDLFFIVFPEKYITKKVEKGRSWEELLSKFRESNRHELMEDLYHYRVLRNGAGNIDDRLRLFKLAFRTKLYNWWMANTPKYTNNE